MKILFLNPPFSFNRPEGLDAPVGIMMLGAVLKEAGHECALVDHAWEAEGDWTKWEAAFVVSPDLVLINTQIRFGSETSEAMRRLRVKHPALPAVAFGPQASTESVQLLEEMGFDACIIGEPEEVIFDILKDITAQQSIRSRPGVATPNDPNVAPAARIDPEKLPCPDWGLADYGRYIRMTHNAVFMTSRGLDHEDRFNQPPLIYAGRPTRRVSVERAIEELKKLRAVFRGSYMLLFHDEVFTEDREWVVRLCGELQKAALGLPFWCFTRPDLVDEELCRLMRASGFVGVSMGMESASDRVLDMLGRQITAAQIEKGFRAAQSAGLLTTGSVMIGNPGCVAGESDETREELRSTVQMVARLHPDVLTVTLMTPLPGTPAYEFLKDRVLAKLPREFNYYHVWPGKYPVRLSALTAEDLTQTVAEIRVVWKKKLWKTALGILTLAVRDGAFRSTLIDQVLKVLKRKVFSA